MNYRDFGRTGLKVSEIGFGCSRIGGVFGEGKTSPAETIRTLQRALDEGINFFDTADMYAQGESEALLGRAFAGRRDRVVIATKGGYCLPAQRKLISRVKPLVRPIVKALGIKRENLPGSVSGSLSQDFSPDYITQAVEQSLRRLKTDYIDVYQLHSPPPDIVDRAEFVGVLEKLKADGKIRHYGIAADSAAIAAHALKIPTVASIQIPFGLLDMEAADELLPSAVDAGVAVIARGCFGGGLLKATLTESELADLTPKRDRILGCRSIASGQDRDILEAALRFVLSAPAVSVTLLGMRTEAHLESNLRMLSTRAMTSEEYASYSNQ